MEKVGTIILIIVIIYFWNKYVLRYIVSGVINFHKKNNSNKLNKQPLKTFVENEFGIITFMQIFYWIGGILISYGIAIN